MLYRKAVICFITCVYALLSFQVAKADDIDLYTESVSGATGAPPVIGFVIDTSGSMGFSLAGNTFEGTLFEERMMPLLYSLHDQFTSMRGTFKVALFNYDAGNIAANLLQPAEPLSSYVEKSFNDGSIKSLEQEVSADIQWFDSSDVRADVSPLTFPYVVAGSSNVDSTLLENVALGAIARQSTTQSSRSASRAIDGEITGDDNFSHTQRIVRSWLELDLGKVRTLSHIKLYNTTCCEGGDVDDLTRFYVLVSDVAFTSRDLQETLKQPGVYSYYHRVAVDGSVEIKVPRTARYVRVQSGGRSQLVIQEIQVMALPEDEAILPNVVNVALNATATHNGDATGRFSGSPYLYPASNAIDGDTSGSNAGDSYSHTAWNRQAWLDLDLGASYPITDINIYNIIQHSHVERDRNGNRININANRLKAFSVFVSDVPFASKNYNTTSGQEGVSRYDYSDQAMRPTVFNIDRTGRYVRVQLYKTNNSYLHLSEIEVMSSAPVTNVVSNVALDGIATQSSTRGNNQSSNGAHHVIDGDVSTNNFTKRGSDSKPEWLQVDLGAMHDISQVNVYNRSTNNSRHKARLKDYYILISENNFDADSTLAEDLSMAGDLVYRERGQAGYPSSMLTPNAKGRYVRLRLTSGARLHAGEFEVMGSLAKFDPLAKVPQHTALEFNDIDVPAGATITRADLVFQSSAISGAQTLAVRLDESLDPKQLPMSGSNIPRDWIEQADQSVSAKFFGDELRVNVTDLLLKKAAQQSPAGANRCKSEVPSRLVFMIEGSEVTEAPIQAYSEDDIANQPTYPNDLIARNPSNHIANKKPTLEIEWSSNSSASCYNKTLNIKTNGIGDDVYQADSNTLIRDSKTIELGNSIATGLRFALVNIAKYDEDESGNKVANDLTTTSQLRLTAANNGSAGTITIQAIEKGLAPIFSTSNPDLRNLDNDITLSEPISWQVPSWNKGEVYTSPDLSSIIEPLLERDDWEYGGTIGLVLGTPDSSSKEIYAWEAWDEALTEPSGRLRVKQRFIFTTNEIDWNIFGVFAPELRINASSSTPINHSKTAREQLIDLLFSSHLNPHNRTPVAGSYAEAAAYMLGARTDKEDYDSPLDEVGACQSNTLVLLTDGAETFRTNTGSEKFTSLVGGECNGGNTADCAVHLAQGLAQGVEWSDENTSEVPDPIRKIDTYTIAYADSINSSSKATLNNIATAGNGVYYSAAEIDNLSQAFKQIVDNVDSHTPSVASVGASSGTLSRLTVQDQLYYSSFQPETSGNWLGNVKRYRLRGDEVLDVKGDEAVTYEPEFQFSLNAQSWWSELSDGPVVTLGGVASHITPDSRKLFTYKGYGSKLDGKDHDDNAPMEERGVSLTDTSEAKSVDLMSSSGTDFTVQELGIDRLPGFDSFSESLKTNLRNQVVQWIQGGTEEQPRTEIGSIIHSSPTIQTFKEDQSGSALSSLFVSSNEGYLHAFDVGEEVGSDAENVANRGGTELFAFMPMETMRNAALLQGGDNSPEDFIYGLDSTWTYWRHTGDDGEIDDKDDHVYLYAGMRRGGNMLYGMNVSDSYYTGDNDPRLLFAIGNPNPHDSSLPQTTGPDVYKDIGQTWSTPRIRRILWGNDPNPRFVLLFGGGYDTQHDDPDYNKSGNEDEKGSQVYMLDAITGELLWHYDTEYSITARIKTISRTEADLVDAFYAVDLGGRVLRFDLNEDKDGFTQHVIADIGGSGVNNRKFYREPSVARQTNPRTNQKDTIISVGSGYVANPKDDTVQEQFYVFYDRHGFEENAPAPNAVIGNSDLVELNLDGSSTPLSTDSDESVSNSIYTANGWTIKLDKSLAEKVIGPSFLFNDDTSNGDEFYGLIYFTGYTYEVLEDVNDTCQPNIGSTNIYAIGNNGAFGVATRFGTSDRSPYIISANVDGFVPDFKVIQHRDPDTGDVGQALLIDKRVITPKAEELCTSGNCSRGRVLERSSWKSRTTTIDTP